jgi:hypothetical protein
MWKSPGAIKARPLVIVLPSLASITSIWDACAIRSAKDLVKTAGICWTTNIAAGISAGKNGITCISALGPPVEDPITTSVLNGAFFPLPCFKKTGGL